VVALAIGLVAVTVAVTVAAAGAVMVARHRAQAAADAAALAGAAQALGGEAVACAAARRVASLNGGSLLDCALDGWDVEVTVGVRPGGPAAGIGLTTGLARAGPASVQASPVRRRVVHT